MKFDEWYAKNFLNAVDPRELARKAWNEALSEASLIACMQFGEDDVARAIDELEAK